MSEVQNTKGVYKIYNNSHYQLLYKKDNFSLLVNKALGKKATSPSTLHSCDSREISLILKATEKAIEENEENEVVRDSLIKLSKELFRDIKKANIMKDGRCIYLCIENQSINRKDVKARIHLYNALSYLTAIDKDGYTIPVITILVLWNRGEWKDMNAFKYRDEHIRDYSQFLPLYKIPTVSMVDLSEEELDGMNDDLKIASYAVKIAKGKMELEEKMKYFEKLKKLFNIVSDEAKDLTLVYTGVNATKEEVMENGFDSIWEIAKTEGISIGEKKGISIGEERGISIGEKRGISIGEKRGISIGENKGILKCILGFQNKNNCSFDEAADAIGVSKETVAQLKELKLI